MTITVATEDERSEAETPLLDDIVPVAVDFKGRPSVRWKSGCWKSASFIIAVGVAERFAYYGISVNTVNYLTGNLGQSTASAAASMNAWFGTSALLPIFGASLADSFTGRFRMIILACLIYVAGLGFMTLSAFLSSQYSSECKLTAGSSTCYPDQIHIIFFFFSLYLVAVAQGGLLPCAQAFGADQFDEQDENEYKAKSSFFNWWVCFANGSIMLPLVVLNYIQENVGWELGFGIPAIAMCFSVIVVLIGTKRYRFRKYADESNPFVRIYRVFVKAGKNRQAAPVAEVEGQQTLSHKCALSKFLDKALLVPDSLIEDDENTCSIADVEDTKSLLRLAPLWCASLGYSIIFAQPSTLFTKQAATLDRRVTSNFQIPSASFQQIFVAIPIMVSLPIYDRIFVPIVRAITKKPSGISMLQRIGTGLLFSLISIMFAAVIERKRLATAREYGLIDTPSAMIPMSVWWLAPQYMLSAIADVLAMVGLQEFFYDQVPIELKSIGIALYYSILGIGSLISSFLISSIQNVTKGNGQGGWFSDNLNRAHLDYFYWLLAGLSAAGLAGFIYFSKSYVYRTKNTVS